MRGWLVLIVVAVLALTLTGCSESGERLVVATWWPMEERVRLESEFRKWLAASNRTTHEPVALEWRLVSGWDDWQPELARRHPPDVILGARIESLAGLAKSRRLFALKDLGAIPWLTVWSGEVRLADRGGRPVVQVEHTLARPDRGAARAVAFKVKRNVTFDDPRIDPVARAWSASVLSSNQFRAGYAQLVQCAASGPRLGRRSGAARGSVARREASLAPALIADSEGLQSDPMRRPNRGLPAGDLDVVPEADVPPRLAEGAAIVYGAANQALAGEFLRFLAMMGAERSPAETSLSVARVDPQLDELIAELVGATLVDAQDELWGAWAALSRSRDPVPALKWMTEPPPWPPASIARLLARGDSDALNLVETLAREITPSAAVRGDLIRSWLAPAGVVDRETLAKLAHLADGRLASEPRFREWLRAEWTVWARQRFRRVERLAAGRWPAFATETTKANP